MQTMVSLSEFVVRVAWFVLGACAIYAAAVLLWRAGIWTQRRLHRKRNVERIMRGFDGFPKLKNRALEAANRTIKPK
jgi:Flp pilus assembly protein TadB